jgi:hypothetical protein
MGGGKEGRRGREHAQGGTSTVSLLLGKLCGDEKRADEPLIAFEVVGERRRDGL